MKSIYTRFALVALCLSLGVGVASVTQAVGTQLGITDSVVSTTCSADDTSAAVNISVDVTTTGSTAPTSLLVSTDGGVILILRHGPLVMLRFGPPLFSALFNCLSENSAP
jgi:hypothetical protein